MLSVLIAARNEIYLEKTIRNVLENAEGEIEIIVELDGYLPDPQIHLDDKRVIFVHHEVSIGQRQCINHAAKIAKGKYIMKLDAHCAVDEGFDVKLAEDCEYDWTVVPRMYNLDIETFKPKFHKRTDYMYISSPTAEKPFRAKYFKKQPKNDKLIDDTMCCMGPGWFMHKDRYWELDGLDEGHGDWGQMGIEVALKAWLSGGCLKVNKKTWFAHWFRGDIGFPYPASGKAHERARKYSRDLWLNDNWDKATRKLDWVIDKFNPKGWKDMPKKTSAKSIASNTSKLKKQHCHITHAIYDMDEMVKNLIDFHDPRRPLERATRRMETMPPFITKILAGETFTDEQLKQQPYYDALIYTQHTSPSKARSLMRDLIKLTHSIKAEGLRNPVDIWKSRDKLVIHRGWRRILIAHQLGYKKVICRVYKSINKFRRLAGYRFHPMDNSINGIAMKQFIKHQDLATDKYWIHQYTPLYDKHIGHKRDDKCKILEIGLLRGASLDLWGKAFPKAKLYGIDITTRWKRMAPKGTKVFQGKQEDVEFLNREVVPQGKYDIIIDDGGHRPHQMQTTFKTLWSSLNDKGIYVIEDLYGNYKKERNKDNTVNVLKELVDEVNINCTVRSICFYYNICFIEKSTES